LRQIAEVRPTDGEECFAGSGSVSNNFQFGGAIHGGKKAVNPGHSNIFQLSFSALPALPYRERPDDHDRRVADFERQVGHSFVHRTATDSAFHIADLLERPASLHCSGSGM